MIDVSSEIIFKTARSGGKGGQNVNKVESMVMGFFHVENSDFFTKEQKNLIMEKLSDRISGAGMLQVKSQEDRSQLVNKEIVTGKINLLLSNAVKIHKKRKPTKPSKFSKEKRIATKKIQSEIKLSRKKVIHD